MTDNTLEILRGSIKNLRNLHKTIKARRGELAQKVAGTEVEMVSARIAAAVQQLQSARDLYTQLRADDASRNELFPLGTDFRGRDLTTSSTKGEQ